MPPAEETRDVIQVIPGPEQHITEAFLNARYGDDESICIRGALKKLELLILGGYKPLVNDKDVVIRVINSIYGAVKEEIHELSSGTEETQVVVPHPEKPIGLSSYKTCPWKVARACTEAMKRDRPQNVSPQAKKQHMTSDTFNSSSK